MIHAIVLPQLLLLVIIIILSSSLSSCVVLGFSASKGSPSSSSPQQRRRQGRNHNTFVQPPSSPPTASKESTSTITSSSSSSSLHIVLQNSFTPKSILENVALQLTPTNDPMGSLSSLTLIRLSKQWIHYDNNRYNNNNNQNNTNQNDENNIHQKDNKDVHDESLLFTTERNNNTLLWEGLSNTIDCLVSSDWTASLQTVESAVEGIKAVAVISRIIQKYYDHKYHETINGLWIPLTEKLTTIDTQIALMLQPHQLSGLKWAVDLFSDY